MKLLKTIILTSIFILILFPNLFAQNSNEVKQKNVLLIISDDHGIDQLGCYGNEKIQTPSLDKLASEGTRFTNAHSVVASCSASRGVILSGLYPHQNGQYGHLHNWHHFSLLDYVETIPSLLKNNGYRTGIIGKVHVGSKSNLEFDYIVYPKEIMGARDAKKIADKTDEFFNQEKEKPFFLLVGYSDPHRDAKGMTNMKNVENFSGFANDEKYEGVTPTKYKHEDVHVPNFLPDIPEVREELADQYEAITRMDKSIGWIIENLKKSGRFEETLIIYISDNGIPFPGAKTTVYKSGLHLPMIVNSPTVKRNGVVNNSMISYVDFLPTILEWTNSEKPKYDLPGNSFLNILEKEDDSSREAVFGSHTFHEVTMFYPMRTIITKKYQYILNLFPELIYPFATDLFVSKTWQAILDKKLEKMGERKTYNYLYRPKEELYDLTRDPVEAVNLVNDPDYENVLKELRKELQKMRENTDDHWLINDNYKLNEEVFIKEN